MVPNDNPIITQYITINRYYTLILPCLFIILIGGWPTPLKNMSSSVGMILPNYWGKQKPCSKPPTSIYIYIPMGYGIPGYPPKDMFHHHLPHSNNQTIWWGTPHFQTDPHNQIYCPRPFCLAQGTHTSHVCWIEWIWVGICLCPKVMDTTQNGNQHIKNME